MYIEMDMGLDWETDMSINKDMNMEMTMKLNDLYRL
jgi:hypothetical protein